METLVATITVNDPTWPWWLLGAGVAMIVLGIMVGRTADYPRQQDVGVKVIGLGFALLLCGIVGGAAVDAGQESRRVNAIERELGYTDTVLYDQGVFSHDYEFTAKNNGQMIHGRIIVKDGTISVLLKQ